ncbi:MAG: sigma-70 family RNA polymerase sigma factor [Myxococcales bacterium]|nr:sigma-70 family RNA polymerase sigma factor [Myxococcales bacterium]
MTVAPPITELLQRLASGDARAADDLAPSLYVDLRRIAHGQRARWRGQATLETTALLHEAWLKVARARGQGWASREHFFAVCTRAMRQILINHAQARVAAKRGGGAVPEPIDGVADLSTRDAELVLAVQQAIDGLRARSERLASIVEYRVYAGFSVDETADILGVSARTVKREWQRARIWLSASLEDGSPAWSALGPR